MKKIYVVILMICMLMTSSLTYATPISNNTKRPEISVLFEEEKPDPTDKPSEEFKINSITTKIQTKPSGEKVVTWTCNATGKDILYSRKLYKDGKVLTYMDYSKINAFDATLKPGKYFVEFTVKDVYNNTQTKRSEEFIVPISIDTTNNTTTGQISASFDLPATIKINRVGEIYEAKIKVKNIKNLAYYQINLQYDPTLIQPIKEDGTPYTSDTTLKGGNILINNAYNPVKSASHQLDKGILYFTGGYKLLDKYKKSGVPETDGTLGVIRFKLLQMKKTTLTLSFVPTTSMPLSKDGIYLFDWDGKINNNYAPVHSLVFTEVNTNSSNQPLEELKINNITANRSTPLNPMATVTWTCDATGKDLTYTYKLFWNGSIFAADENVKSNSFRRPVVGPGKYVLEVTVKDAYNRTVTKNSSEIVVPAK